MLTTRTTASRRPAAFGAGRLLSPVVLVIALVIGTVFAHGGACAAVELSEPVAHGVHFESGAVQESAHCLHNQLPEHHRHGTEQDFSATGPAATPSSTTAPAAPPGCSMGEAGHAPQACGGLARLVGAHPETLCVMRI
ncbi:hypothetical protein [Nonomuraea antimicrobica]